MPESAYGRVGEHTESGLYTDADWFRIYAEHLEIHARQIERNLAAWQTRDEEPAAARAPRPGPLAICARYASFVVMCALALVHEGTRGPTLRRPAARTRALRRLGRPRETGSLAAALPAARAGVPLDRAAALGPPTCGPVRWSRSRAVCASSRRSSGRPIRRTQGRGSARAASRRRSASSSRRFHVFVESSQRAYLTQEPLFSGHAATTFLLWLYLRKRRWLGPLALAGTSPASAVFLAHLHYTIDVLGAWAVTWGIYACASGAPERSLRARWPISS